MTVRGVRGATTVDENSADAILSATRELLLAVVAANDFAAEDVASAWFTVTPDLNAAFPATAARQIGWDAVPLMDAVEVDVPGAMPRCIRVLVNLNTEKRQDEITFVYQRGAAHLRATLPPVR